MSRVLILVALAVLVGVAAASFCSGTDCKDCSAFGCRSDSDCRTKCGSLYWDSEADWECREVNGVMTCVDGPMCQEGRYNCRNGFNDGCESTTKCCPGGSDASVCGSLPNAEVVGCNVYGACGVLKCAEGFEDCDGLEFNGCEVDTSSTVDHCGSCDSCWDQLGWDVDGDHGFKSMDCVDGECQYECVDGLWDCNFDSDDGCESPVPCCDYDALVDEYNSSVCGAAKANSQIVCWADGAYDTTGDFTGWINYWWWVVVDDDYSLEDIDARYYEGACNFVCKGDYYDCDGEPENGCESHTPCCVASETGWHPEGNYLADDCQDYFYDLGVDGLNTGTSWGCNLVDHGCNVTNDDFSPNPVLKCRTDGDAHDYYFDSILTDQNGDALYVSSSWDYDSDDDVTFTYFDCDGLQWNGCESSLPCCTRTATSAAWDPAPCSAAFSAVTHVSTDAAKVWNCLALADGTGLGQCKLHPTTACVADDTTTPPTPYGNCDGIVIDLYAVTTVGNGCETPINQQGFCGSKCLDCTLYGLYGETWVGDYVYDYDYPYANQDPDSPLMRCAGSSCAGLQCRTGYYDCDGDIMTGCESSLPCCNSNKTCGNVYPRGRVETYECLDAAYIDEDYGMDNFCVPATCGLNADGQQTYDCDGDWWMWWWMSGEGYSNGCESVNPCVAVFVNVTSYTVDDYLYCYTDCGDGRGSCCGDDCECGDDLTFGCDLPNVATYDIYRAYYNGDDMQCWLETCKEGFFDCDGVNLNGCESTAECCSGPSDIANGVLPSSATNCDLDNVAKYKCTEGACAISKCLTGTGNCDADESNGCETALATDKTNCGACGTVCAATSNQDSVDGFTCANGKCSAVCKTGFLDCDKNFANGCERAGTACTTTASPPPPPPAASTPSAQTTNISGASTVAVLSAVAYLVVLLL